jgi:hypothetical protein
MFDPLFPDLERRRHVEDRLTMLDRHNPPGCITSTIADSVNFVNDGYLLIPRPEKIAMHGMRATPLDRLAGGDQGLAEHLPAEQVMPAGIAAFASIKIFIKPLKGEVLQKIREKVFHQSAFAISK